MVFMVKDTVMPHWRGKEKRNIKSPLRGCDHPRHVTTWHAVRLSRCSVKLFGVNCISIQPLKLSTQSAGAWATCNRQKPKLIERKRVILNGPRIPQLKSATTHNSLLAKRLGSHCGPNKHHAQKDTQLWNSSVMRSRATPTNEYAQCTLETEIIASVAELWSLSSLPSPSFLRPAQVLVTSPRGSLSKLAAFLLCAFCLWRQVTTAFICLKPHVVLPRLTSWNDWRYFPVVREGRDAENLGSRSSAMPKQEASRSASSPTVEALHG